MTQNKMVKAIPCHAKQVLRRSGGIALPILILGARLGWMVNTTPQLLISVITSCDNTYYLHVTYYSRSMPEVYKEVGTQSHDNPCITSV